jgi:WD40 repeat protein
MSAQPAGVRSSVPPPTVDADNPWPGLAAFGEQDRAYFYGREREAEELRRLVMRERVTVLFGLSGLGKSSLLQAGLFPLVRAENVFPVYIRLDFTPERLDLFAQIIAAIAAQAATADIEAPPVGDAATLWEYFHRRDADFWNRRNRPVMPLLVFDQFEEVFTLGRADTSRSIARETLIEQMSDLAEGRPPAGVKARLDLHPQEAAAFAFKRHHYKILLGVREDFLAELEGLRERLSAVALNRYRLRRMSGDAALLVVNQAPHLVDTGVAEQVVRFVGAGQPGVALSALEVEPALLSVVCRELNEKRRDLGEPKISPRLLERSQEAVLSGFYENSVDDLPAGARSFIEERLLTVSGYRDSVALENALRAPDMSRAVIDRLVERRLVRIEDRGGVARIELTHDLLTGVVRASRDRRREAEASQREFVATQEAQERERRAVAQLRRSRKIAVAFLLLALIAVAASALSFLAQREAGRQEQSARAAVARLAVQDAERHVANGRRDLALAHVAYALRNDPDSLPVRGWMADLLRRAWWLPGEAIRPEAPVLATVIGANGVRVVTASEQGIRVVDAMNGKALGEPVRLDGAEPSVLFVGEGRILLTQGRDALLLDTDSGQPVRRLKLDAGIDAKGSDGRHLLTTGSAYVDAPISLWDLEAGKIVAHLQEDLMVLDVAKGGRRLLTWSNEEGNARVWDTLSGTPLGDALNPGDIISSTARFSPDGRRVITAFRPDKARIWDAETGKPVGDVLEHGAFVGFVSFSPDSRRVLTASASAGTSRVWDVETGEDACPAELPHVSIESAHWSHDGRRLLIREKEHAQVWDLQRCTRVGELLRHEDAIESAAISADGRRVLTASGRAVYVWDEYNSAPPYPDVLGTHGAPVGFSRDGRRALLIANTPDGQPLSVRLWDVESEDRVGQAIDGYPISFSEDGRRLLVQSGAGLQALDTATGRTIANLMNFEFGPGSTMISRDGRRLLDVSTDKATLWDIDNGKPIGESFGGSRTESVFLGNGHRVIRVFSNGTLRVWDTENGKPVGQILAHKGHVSSVTFSSDERRALITSFDAPTQILDMATGKPVGDGFSHDGPVSSETAFANAPFASFSPDGRVALIAVANGSAQMFNAEDGKPIGRPLRQSSAVRSAVMNGTGSVVATEDQDSIRLWDMSTGSQIGEPLSAFRADNCRTMFSGDGRLLLVPVAHDAVRVFDAKTGRALGEPLPKNGPCAVFAAEGRSVITSSGDGMVQVLEALVDVESPEATDRLANIAEAFSGHRVNALGWLDVLEDRQQVLAEWRSRQSRAAGDRPVKDSPIRRVRTIGFR